MLQPKLDFAAIRERTIPLPEDRARAIASSVRRRRAQEGARLRSYGVLAVAAAAAVVVLALRGRPAPVALSSSPPAKPVAVAAAPDWGGVVMADGTRVTFLVEGTELAQSAGAGRSPTLVHGAARFDVVHDDAVPFRVTARSVVIEDLGTVFTVRLNDDRTAVSVEAGVVSVRGSGREKILRAGESEEFAPLPSGAPGPAAPSAFNPAPPPPAHQAAVTPAGGAAQAGRPTWTKLAQAGEYDRAYGALQATGAAVHDDPEELLLAADSARLSGHADRAVPLLRRLVAQFPSDSRAGLAAFTLGRVLLDDLDQPRDAASAFAAAYVRGGPLAEDALSREVEAWSRAGDHAAAGSAADRYLAAYPNGRRAAYVRRVHAAEVPGGAASVTRSTGQP